MSVFSTNQTRHLYVVNSKVNAILSDSAKGAIAVKTDTAKNHLYFEYMGAGGQTRSDLIDIKNIIYAKATDAEDMERELSSYTIELQGNLAANKDYILRIVIKNYIGLSEENMTAKYGMVHTPATPVVSDFYKEMAISLAKNLGNEGLIKVTLTDSTDAAVPVTAITNINTLTGTYKNIVIDEIEQPWSLGLKESKALNLQKQDIQFVPVTVNGEDIIWGTAEETASKQTVGNGKKIADMEYFYMSERGDIYKNMGYPNVVHTEYLVDPANEYNTIDIHYAYVGSNEAVQKSEKDITLVIPKDSGDSPNATTNSIITAINTAIKATTGIEIAAL